MRGTRELESDLLVGLGQHRTLSTRQVHAMYVPQCGLRWTQLLLVSLEERGLVARAMSRGSGRWLLWYLTERGLEQVDPLALATPVKKVVGERQVVTIGWHHGAIESVHVALEVECCDRRFSESYVWHDGRTVSTVRADQHDLKSLEADIGRIVEAAKAHFEK